MAEGSKAKFLRELLDRSLDLRVPEMAPEEFERIFNLKATAEEIQQLTFAEVIARQLVMKAAAGNDRSITDIFDRLLGKPLQQTESVSKSYTYHDFLIELKKADAPRRVGPVVTAVLTAPDPLADLL